MSMINYASREINCKIVYYGPGLCGKTTNLEYVYEKVAPNTRGKLILKGVDGVVFVGDSQVERLDANIESMHNLYENLAEYGLDLREIPFVIQYNKRDLPNISSLDELQRELNPNLVPHFEAVAVRGIGVFDTLKAVSKLVIKSLS